MHMHKQTEREREEEYTRRTATGVRDSNGAIRIAVLG